jgi:hypothetical protein
VLFVGFLYKITPLNSSFYKSIKGNTLRAEIKISDEAAARELAMWRESRSFDNYYKFTEAEHKNIGTYIVCTFTDKFISQASYRGLL